MADAPQQTPAATASAAASPASAPAVAPAAAPSAAPAPAPAAPAGRARRLAGSVTGVFGSVSQVFAGLLSPDWPTRRMSLLFVLSLAGMIVVGTMAVQRYRWLRAHAKLAAVDPRDAGVEHLGDFIGKQALEARRKNTTLVVGTFYVELKYDAGADAVKLVPGVASAAEVEVVAECDVKKTCDFLEQHGQQTRNEIINVLVPMDREELMSRDGKRRLKKAIQERLNGWIPDGRIENVYFSRLIVG